MVAALFVLTFASSAHADLRAVADRVAAGWNAAGAEVVRAPPRFLNDDETLNITFSPPYGGCTSVALVAARGLSFHARILPDLGGISLANGESTSTKVSSVAGVLAFTRCGSDDVAAAPQRVMVTGEAGRGVIETIVARSHGPLPALDLILPERTGGLLPRQPYLGEPPAIPALAKRVEATELRARRDRATFYPPTYISVGPDGFASLRVTLSPGCHRIDVMATEPRLSGGFSTRLDVDAELRDANELLIVRDRSDGVDARLETCVDEKKESQLVLVGGAPNAPAAIVASSWAIPERIPHLWGPSARAKIASAALSSHATFPDEAPIVTAQGPAGTVTVPVAIEPGACYLAVGAITHGVAHRLAIRVAIGSQDVTDERGHNGEAWTIGFCAGAARRAAIKVEVRGAGVAWGLAMYQLHAKTTGRNE